MNATGQPNRPGIVSIARIWATRDAVRRGWDCLDAAERLRADAFRSEPARDLFVTARSAVRMGLGAWLGIAARDVCLVVSPRGKPELAQTGGTTGWHFNVAHSGTLAVVAFARGFPVGIDVESMASIPEHETDALAATHFSEGERREWHESQGTGIVAGFLRVWTRKEAVLKASGEGLVDDLAGVDTSRRPRVLGKWDVREIEMPPGYVGSVAAAGTDWDAAWARE